MASEAVEQEHSPQQPASRLRDSEPTASIDPAEMGVPSGVVELGDDIVRQQPRHAEPARSRPALRR
jgi:hypothetical protein